jgi:hypothetical protein
VVEIGGTQIDAHWLEYAAELEPGKIVACESEAEARARLAAGYSCGTSMKQAGKISRRLSDTRKALPVVSRAEPFLRACVAVSQLQRQP